MHALDVVHGDLRELYFSMAVDGCERRRGTDFKVVLDVPVDEQECFVTVSTPEPT